MAMKNDTEGGERCSKKHILHEATTKESREDRKKRLLKMLEFLDSQEYKENFMVIDEWSSRDSITKNPLLSNAREQPVYAVKVGFCPIEHGNTKHEQKIPCYRCECYLKPWDGQ